MFLEYKDKEIFVSTLDKLKAGLQNREDFDKTIERFSSGFVVLNVCNDWLDGLIDLLAYMVDDTNDIISWWLFENVEKIIYIEANSKLNPTNQEIKFDVSTPEKLFDYFVFLKESEGGKLVETNK